jgi:putative copper export protein
MQKQLIFGMIRSLHDLFTAFWIGGMLTTGFAFLPIVQNAGAEPKLKNKLLKFYQSKLRVVGLISIGVLWITGLLLSKQAGGISGFLCFTAPYHTLISIKHLVVFMMIVIGGYRGFILGQKIEKFNQQEQKTYMLLLFINIVLGVAVIFLSGFGAALV